MTEIDKLVDEIAPLRREDLETWVRESLVISETAEGTVRFSEIECARVRLLCTLRYDLEIDNETLPLILSLVDQLYEARGKLNALTSAVAAQSPEVRDAIKKILQQARFKSP